MCQVWSPEKLPDGWPAISPHLRDGHVDPCPLHQVDAEWSGPHLGKEGVVVVGADQGELSVQWVNSHPPHSAIEQVFLDVSSVGVGCLPGPGVQVVSGADGGGDNHLGGTVLLWLSPGQSRHNLSLPVHLSSRLATLQPGGCRVSTCKFPTFSGCPTLSRDVNIRLTWRWRDVHCE